MPTNNLPEPLGSPLRQRNPILILQQRPQMEALIAQLQKLSRQIGRRVDREYLVQEVRELVVGKVERETELLVGLADLVPQGLRHEQRDAFGVQTHQELLLLLRNGFAHHRLGL